MAAEIMPQGLPPLHVTQIDPDVYPRFYSVAQSPDGLLFVAGEEGIHSYDGREWTTTRLPNQRFVRSLEHDGMETLYVGGYGQFGYLELDDTRRPVFTDLTPELSSIIDSENLADIWHIEITPNGVFFRALYHLFQYKPESGDLTVWHHPDRFGGVLWHEGELWVQFRQLGLQRLDGEEFTMVPGGQQLTEHIIAFLPLPGGGLLTMGREGPWQHFHKGQLSLWAAPESLPSPDNFDAYQVLPDGSFALGAADGHVHLLDPSSLSHRVFRVAFDFISDLAISVDGGLLVQTDQATTHLFWPHPWTKLGTESGLVGRVNEIVRWGEDWIAITSAGAQRVHFGRFEPTGWSNFETWDWMDLDSGGALLADSFNLLRITETGGARQLFLDLYPRKLQESQYRTDHVLIGTEHGLSIVRQKGEDFDLVFQQQGFTGLITEIMELADGDLLMSINGTGLVRATLSDDWRAIEIWRVYSSDDGLDYGAVVEADIVKTSSNDFLVSTRAGYYNWEGGQLKPQPLPGLPVPDGQSPLIRFDRSPDGERWAYQQRQLWREDDQSRWRVEDLSELNPVVIASLSFMDDGRIMVGDQAAVHQFQPAVEADHPTPLPVRMRSAQLTDASGRTRRLPLDGRELVLPFGEYSIRLDYGIPSFRQSQANRYRARLIGFEEEFSDWVPTTGYTYTLRNPGIKRFEVQARDHLGSVSEMTPFEFRMEAPWYSTAWARAIWAILIFASLIFFFRVLIRWRLARLEAERQRLAEMVDQRTADLAAAVRKLRNMANVDGLTGLANRRRLDEYLKEAWVRCIDRQCDLAIALLDIDHFKAYNDTHGHPAGDEVLRKMGDVLACALRRNEDVAARYGGEEFMVVLPAADLEHALEIGEVLRAAVEASPLGITASVGVASTRPDENKKLEDLINTADQALYRAKQMGRNRVDMGL
ncbi:MAG: diguanylate cyclase [Pseudomonadota bacterium]